MFFAYSTLGNVVFVSKAEVFAIAKHAKHGIDTKTEEADFINDDEEDAPKPPKIPVPMMFIGTPRLRNVLCVVSNLKDSTWSVHPVHYQASPRVGFKKSELDALPHMTLSLSYSKALEEGYLF